ncbi:MAG: hypothetical protein ACR2MA_05215 [Egibacteraceae bacterium]
MMTPSCVFRVDAALIERLDERLGPPLDSYVSGWQVWLEDHGPDGATLEWRLHPPAGFAMPRGVNPHDLFELVLQGISEVEAPDTEELELGRERLRLRAVWEVLEIFPTFGDELEPRAVSATVVSAIDRAADAVGYVDHDLLGDLYKGRRGDFSVGEALLAQLQVTR